MKPIVDGLEAELGSRLQIIRLNLQSEVGRNLAPAYGFQLTPTFIYFDSNGSEVWRSIGSLDPLKVRLSLETNP